MDSDLLKSFLPIFGVILGALIGYFSSIKSVKIQNELKEEKERKEFLRSQIEEAYRLAIKARYEQRELFKEIILRLKYGQKTDTGEVGEPPFPLHELELKINLYLPELDNPFKALQNEIGIHINFYAQILRTNVQQLGKEQIDDLMNQARENVEGVDSGFSNFTTKLSELIDNLE